MLLWSLTCPIGAFLFAGSRESVAWFVAYMVLLVAAVSTVTFMLLQYLARQNDRAFHLLHVELEKSERLLYNVLPHDIAPALKEGGENRRTFRRC